MLMRMLGKRLDNVIRRMGWERTIWGARKLVGNGHILVNGRKVNIPSFRVSVGDEITLKAGIQKVVRENMETMPGHNVPGWLMFDPSTLTAKVTADPTPDEIPFDVDMNLIV